MKKVNIAVIGLGRISRTHIDGIKRWPELTNLAAVVDVQETVAKLFSEEFKVPYFTSVEAALKEPSIDAVVLCLPHFLHEPVTVQACNAGKHVLVEKTMANTYSEGQSMVAAAKKNGVNLMVGQSQRWFNAVQEAKRRLPQIGKILNLHYTWCVFINSVAKPPSWWKLQKDTGGLIHSLIGSHSIDFTLFMIDDRKPISVYAQGAANNPNFEGDSDATIIIGFDDGTHATNLMSQNSRIPKHDCLIIGSQGTMFLNHTGDWVGLLGTAATALYINEKLEMDGDQDPHNFAVQMKEFIDSILEGRKPVPSGEDILPQLKIIEAVRQSAEEKKVISLI